MAVGGLQLAASKLGMAKEGAGELCAAERHLYQGALVEFRPVQACPAQVGPRQAHPLEDGLAQVRVREVYGSEVEGPGLGRGAELPAPQPGTPVVAPGERDARPALVQGPQAVAQEQLAGSGPGLVTQGPQAGGDRLQAAGGDGLAEKVQGLGAGQGQGPGVGVSLQQGLVQVPGQEILVQGGVGEAECVAAGPDDEGGGAQVLFQALGVDAGVFLVPVRVAPELGPQPVAQVLEAAPGLAVAPEVRGQGHHQPALVLRAQLVLGVVALQPALHQLVIEVQGLDAALVPFAPLQGRDLLAEQSK